MGASIALAPLDVLPYNTMYKERMLCMNNISFRPKAEIPALLEKVAALLERPKSWVINEALDAYLHGQAALVEKIEAGVRFADSHPEKMIGHVEAMAQLRRAAAKAK